MTLSLNNCRVSKKCTSYNLCIVLEGAWNHEHEEYLDYSANDKLKTSKLCKQHYPQGFTALERLMWEVTKDNL